MTDRVAPVEIALRIPGKWSHPKELLAALPEDHRCTGEELILPDGTKIGFGAAAADTQFAEIFRTSCRNEPTDEEKAIVDDYAVNIFLSGPGGSMKAAHVMMQAASAIVRAGAGGVFIDNSALAHGGHDWLSMTDDGGSDALSFAFVGILKGKTDAYTMGMHVLGLRDVVMKVADIEEGGFDIVEVIRYLARGDKPVDNGHVIADLDGPRFQAFTQDGDPRMMGSPMYNPFGRLKLVSLREIKESN